MKKLQGQGRV